MTTFNGERRSPLSSIRTYCVWCCGESAQQVRDCPSMKCAFWPYRLGSIPPGASRGLMAAIKARCMECAADGKPAECDASQEYAGHPACPCWPYRLGRNPNIGTAQREKLRAIGKKRGFVPSPQAKTGPRINPDPKDGAKATEDDSTARMAAILAEAFSKSTDPGARAMGRVMQLVATKYQNEQAR